MIKEYSDLDLYEKYFEDDLNNLNDEEINENNLINKEIENENYFNNSIIKIKNELNELNKKNTISTTSNSNSNHNDSGNNSNSNNNSNNDLIEIEGWNELLTSIIQNDIEIETNLNFLNENNEIKSMNLSNSMSNLVNDDKTKKLSNEALIKYNFQNLFEEIERNEEVQELLNGMIDSIEYMISLELDKAIPRQDISVDINLTPFDDSTSLLKDFVEFPAIDKEMLINKTKEEEEEIDKNENITQSNLLSNEISNNISEDLRNLETKHQQTLESLLNIMDIDLQKREEEYRQTIEADKRLREERKEKVKRELEQKQKQNNSAICIQKYVRRYIQRKGYLEIKLEIQTKKLLRREREERNQMQKEDHFSRDYEDKMKRIKLEEIARVERLREEDRRLMIEEEKYTRRLLQQEKLIHEKKEREKKEAEERRIKEEREERERIEKEKKEKEEQERIRVEMEKKRLEQEKQQKEAEERKKREEQEEKEKKEKKEKKEREMKQQQQILNTKKSSSSSTTTTTKKMTNESLTARNSNLGWGGEIIKETIIHHKGDNRDKNVNNSVNNLDGNSNRDNLSQYNNNSEDEDEDGDEDEYDKDEGISNHKIKNIKSNKNENVNENDKLQSDESFKNLQNDTNTVSDNHDDKSINESNLSILVAPIVNIPNTNEVETVQRINKITQKAIELSKLPVVYVSSNNENIKNSNDRNKNVNVNVDVDVDINLETLLICALTSWKEFHSNEKERRREKEKINQKSLQTTIQKVNFQSCNTKQYQNIYELKMSVEGLQDISFLLNYPKLKKLECNVNQIISVEEISKYECSLSLEEISIKDNKLVSLNGFQSLSSLKVLYLDVNQLNDINPIQNLPNLITLSVNMNKLSAVPILNISTLQKYELYHNRIETISMNCLQNLPSLTHLNLGRNKLSFIDGKILSQCNLLTHLILSQNQLTSVPTPLYLPNLKFLWLSKNKITNLDPWIESNKNIDKNNKDKNNKVNWPVFLPLLEKLYLQDNEINLISSKCFSTSLLLNELDVSFNHLEPNSINGILDCNSLKILQVQENPLMSNLLCLKQIQNKLVNLTEFCTNSVDIMKGIYYYGTNPPPLSINELEDEKKLIFQKTCQSLQNLRLNNWRNITDVFRISQLSNNHLNSSISTNKSSIEPIEPIIESYFIKCWKSFLLNLLEEQNYFKFCEKSSKLSQQQQQQQQQQNDLIDIKNSQILYVELLSKHYEVLLSWDPTKLQSTITFYQNPFLPPTQQQQYQLISHEKRKESKEMMSVIRARETHASISIQSLWRGYITRKKLSKIFLSSKYYDKDLEELIDANKISDYIGLINETLPELSDDWLLPKSSNISNIESKNTIVYGDHRRKKLSSPRSNEDQIFHSSYSSYSSNSSNLNSLHIPNTPEKSSEKVSPRGQISASRIFNKRNNSNNNGKNDEWITSLNEMSSDKKEVLKQSGVYIQSSSNSNSNGNLKSNENIIGEEEWENDELRRKYQTLTSLSISNTTTLPNIHMNVNARPSSDISTRPASSSSTISGTSSQRFGQGNYDGDNDVDMLLQSARSRISSTPLDWNATDPTAVDNMFKNSKKNKYSTSSHGGTTSISSSTAAKKKELESDPTYRYEKYTKLIETMGSNVNVTKGNTKTSGSFGGRPKMVRNTQQKKHGPPPAWLVGPDEQEK